ncbi:uncharacterized protein LOC116351934, partial [Contarinia nasturtii]|uniref:uncharacterized protein LOC116351934 n=1 Tax=Contarinia nasturtii TaxID=265458 RepID=UPI0012D38FF8
HSNICVVLFFFYYCAVSIATSDTHDIENLLGKLNNVADIFNDKLDKKVPWTELNDAIEILNKILLDYKDNARRKISELRSKNVESRNHYVFAVTPLLSWCHLVNSSIQEAIGQLKQPALSVADKKHIKLKLERVTKAGVDKSEKSQIEIQKTIESMSYLENLLTAVEFDLRENVSGAFDLLGIAELQEALKKAKNVSKNVGDALAVEYDDMELVFAIGICQDNIEDIMSPLFSNSFIKKLERLVESCVIYNESHHNPTETMRINKSR